MNDPYASEEETKALLVPDTRTHSMKHLDALLESRGAWEQGADPYTVLYGIALDILNGVKHPKQCWRCGDMDPKFIAECMVPACDMKGKP
jgi:hypothetical protein